MAEKFDINKVKWFTGNRGLPEAYYKINVPSVSAVLSTIPDPEYEEWVRREGKDNVERIMQLAAYRGTAMHAFIENFLPTYSKTKDVTEALRNTQVVTPPLLEAEGVPPHKIDEGRELFYKFYYSDFPTQFAEVIGMEVPIYSPSLFYRGKLDIFYSHRIFSRSVTDFKTSNGFIKKGSLKEYKYKCQLGGYVGAIEEMYAAKEVKITRASVLCINTKSEGLQEVICEGKELEDFKQKFRELAREWHVSQGQEYLLG